MRTELLRRAALAVDHARTARLNGHRAWAARWLTDARALRVLAARA